MSVTECCFSQEPLLCAPDDTCQEDARFLLLFAVLVILSVFGIVKHPAARPYQVTP